MSSRLERRFEQARHTSESPIAYSGVSPLELPRLPMAAAREVIEALVRTRATQTHTDIVAGQEHEIRSLSPYFVLFRDVPAFERAIQLHTKERTGVISQYITALKTIQGAEARDKGLGALFVRYLDTKPLSQALSLCSGQVTLKILAMSDLSSIISDPSPVRVKRVRERITFDEIPVAARQEAWAEASDIFSGEIEIAQSEHADRVMKKEHSELTRMYKKSNVKAAPSLKDEEIMTTYERLHDRLSHSAPLPKSLETKMKAFALDYYLRSSNHSKHRSQQEGTNQTDVDTKRLASAIKQKIKEVHIRNGSATSIGGSERKVLGALALSDQNTSDMRFLTLAGPKHGCHPKELLPYLHKIQTDLPREVFKNKNLSEQEIPTLYLVTAQDLASETPRVFIEGQIYQATTA